MNKLNIGAFQETILAGDGVAIPAGNVSTIESWLVRKFLHRLGNPELWIRLWDGKKIHASYAEPSVGMVIQDRSTLFRLLRRPLLYFGDDYCAGRIEVEGELIDFLQVVYRAMSTSPLNRRKSFPDAYKLNQPKLNSINGSKQNIHYHYDIGNDFYRMWLDDEMQYTCAYYANPAATLDTAQIAKMDLICRKLLLKPGQTVVEAGCGWGGLARYMAKNYGVRVTAYNISHEQIVYARHRAAVEGVNGQVEYIEDDYRSICGNYDVFVSVGMLEHVGPDHYSELGAVIDRSLSEHGVGLIHTIGQNQAIPMSPWFLKRIFPGSYPPTIREIMTIFEPREFTVLDVENLRLHYARTCGHWLERFEQNLGKVREIFDECFIRAWRLYLSGCVANFSIGSLQLFQLLFSRQANNSIPWIRSHLAGPVTDR